MKKSKKIVLVSIALIGIILSFMGGHTFAKYMSRVTGNGSAEIASWNFKVNENEEQMQTIELKSTINNKTLVNNKIAPGTEGNFQIKLDATDSDVGINYIVRFENESTKPTNLKFTYEGKTYNSITELGQVLTGIINANDENKVKTIDIGWNWQYETGSTLEEIAKNDLEDTKNAKEISNYTFNILVTGTQVMPEN